MRRIILVAIFVALFTHCLVAGRPTPETVAFDFFVAALITGDLERADSLVKPDAIRKNGAPGSVMTDLRRDWKALGDQMFAGTRLREAFFVQSHEPKILEERFLEYLRNKGNGKDVPDSFPPEIMRSRLGLKEGRTVGLFFLEKGIGKELRTGFVLIAVEEVDGTPLVVYTSDD